MNDLMMKMALRAAEDEALFASLIQAYSKKTKQDWSQIAAECGIDETQLANLALCHRPRRQTHLQDIAQIATYVQMNSSVLSAFVRRLETPLSETKQTRKRPSFKWEMSAMFKRRTIAFGFATLLILVFAAFVFAQPAGEKATLVVSTGQATVTHTESMLLVIPRQVETTLASGSTTVVEQGDKITLSDTATAQLHLFDGSTVDLYEGATLELAELFSSETSHRVELYLLAGRTVNRVVKLLGADDAFQVRTPSSTASVRGTVFTVEAISAKETYVAVAEGLVQVAMADQKVDVHPGEAVTAVVGQPLSVEPHTNAPTINPTQPADALNTGTPSPTNTSTNTSTSTSTNTSTSTSTSTDTSTPMGTSTIISTVTIAPTVTVPTPTNTSPPATNTPVPAPTGTLPPVATETSSDSVTLCHFPPGNPANPQTLVVAASAVAAHLAHGDYLGPCQQPPAATETPSPVPPTVVPPTVVPPTAVPPTAVPPTEVPPTEVPPTPEPPDVTLCHFPSGNPDNPQTIVVAASAVAAHLAHGDYLGPCQ